MRRPVRSWPLLLAALAATSASGLALGSTAQAASCPGSPLPQCPYDRMVVLGTAAEGTLHSPVAADLAPDGRLFVVDASTPGPSPARLDIFDRAGRYAGNLQPATELYSFQPHGVAVTASGTVAALDSDGYRLWRFTPDGRPLPVLQLTGLGPGRVTDGPRAAEIAPGGDDSFWVSYNNELVEHRAADGSVLGAFSAPGTLGRGLGVAPDGHVFLDSGDSVRNVAEYTPDGRLVRKVNAPAVGRISFTADGRMLSGGGGIVSRTERDGTAYEEVGAGNGEATRWGDVWGVLAAPPDLLAAAPAGQEAFVVVGDGVRIVATDGRTLATVGAPSDDALQQPFAAWGRPDGSLVVGDAGHARLAGYDIAGTFTGRADLGAPSFVEAGAYNPATGESDVIDALSGSVRRVAPGGAVLGSWPLPDHGGSFADRSLAVDPADGTIYVADAGQPHDGRVLAYAPDGAPQRTITGPATGPGHVDLPVALAAGPDHELLVANGIAGTEAIDVYGQDGAFRRRVLAPQCLNTHSMAVDAAGRIFLADNSHITILDRTGAFLGAFGVRGSAPGEFIGTHLSVIGSVLSITDPANSRVTRVHLDPRAFSALPQPPCGGPATTPAADVSIRGRYARASLRCTGVTGYCLGTAILVPATGSLARAKTLSSARFLIRSGTARPVALALRTHERRILRSKRRLKLRLRVAPAVGKAITRTVTLRLPKRR